MLTAYVYIPLGLEGFELSSTADPLTFRKQLIYAGKFAKGKQEFEVDDALLAHWKKTGDEMLANGIDVPMPIEHTTDPEKNRGKVVGYEVGKDKTGRNSIFASVKFRDADAAKLAKSANVSVFVPPSFTDGAKRTYARPIRHVALTDYPVIPGLDGFEPIAASLSNPLNADVGALELMYPPTAQNPAMGTPPAAPPAAPGAPPAPAPGQGGPIKALAGNLGIQVQPNQDDNAVIQLIVAAFNQLKQKIAQQSQPVQPLAPAPAPGVPPKIAASMVNMLKENRANKLDALVKHDKCARITPAVKTALEAIFCTDDVLTLSLSQDSPQDNFDKIVAALADNDLIDYREQTGGQTFMRLSHGNGDKGGKSAIEANAEKRAEEAKANSAKVY